jgi:signal transduction histidine kinase
MSIIILTQVIQLEADVVLARQRARQIAALLAFEPQNQIRIATAVSEIARNAFEYGHGGRIEYFVDEQVQPQRFSIRISDKGPGIANIEAILNGQGSAGTGISGARRLMDYFTIESQPGAGTTVVLGKNLPANFKKLTNIDIGRLAQGLTQQFIDSPFKEIQLQNQELLRTLDEVRQAHDELEQRVHERTAELAATNEALREEIRERERAQDEVHRLNAELEQRVIERTAQLELLNKELEAFSYSVSHDLRAPLRNINSFSQILVEEHNAGLGPEGQELVQDIRTATIRMGNLIEDLLNLSHVSRSEMVITAVNMSAIAKSIFRKFRKAQPERIVSVVIEEHMVTQGDNSLLEVALENLLGNAWKFTEKQPFPHIEFGRQQIDDETTYFVRDNGAGFNMKYVNKLFLPFQRLHRAVDFEGTGIGLATVYRIISRHGGRVWAEGQVGEGATFYFTLS